VKVKIPDDNTRESIFGARNEIATWLKESEEIHILIRGDIHHVATIMSMHYGVPMSGIAAHAIAKLWEDVRDEIPVDQLKRYDKRIRSFKALRAKHLKATGANKYHRGRGKVGQETTENKEQRRQRIENIEREQGLVSRSDEQSDD
jgi:hypothetical protein